MITDQQQGARMLTLGERLIQAAKLAVSEHLHQSVDQAHLLESAPVSTTALIEIGGADPVSVDDENPLLLAHRRWQTARHSRRHLNRRAEAA